MSTEQIDSISMLAHELRTPLNAVLGFTQVLLSEIDGPVTPEQREDLKIIHSAGERLRSLFSHFLDFWEVSLRPVELHSEDSPLLSVLEGAAGEIGRLSAEPRRPVPKVAVEPGDLLARVDAHRLKRALVALGAGALKRPSVRALRLSARGHEGRLEITVREQGEGVMPEDELRVADIDDLADESPDMLLALWPVALAKRVVEAHGGTTSVAWVEGEGYSTQLRLPLEAGVAAGAALTIQPGAQAPVARSKVLSAMGHELKNPMNSITGFADMLSSGAEGALNTEQLKNVSIIRSSAEQLLRLTSAMVDDARLEAGTFTLRRQRVAPGDLLTDTTALLQTRSGGAVVHVDVAPTLPAVHIDRGRTADAVSALAAMAIEATREQISILARPHRFSSDEAPLLEFSITGNREIGSPTQLSPAQLLDEGSPAVDGLSLEVSVARRVVEQQGGKVWHETGSAGAFRVCLTLPISDRA